MNRRAFLQGAAAALACAAVPMPARPEAILPLPGYLEALYSPAPVQVTITDLRIGAWALGVKEPHGAGVDQFRDIRIEIVGEP